MIIIKELASIEKGNGKLLKVSILENEGLYSLDIRDFFFDKNLEEFQPSNGIILKPEVFKELLAALEKSKTEITKLFSEKKE